MTDMRKLFANATEPEHAHCAHIFENDGKRGAYGKWCHNPPAVDDYCAAHHPNRVRWPKLRGECSVCGRDTALTRRGTVPNHSTRSVPYSHHDYYCRGGGLPPAGEPRPAEEPPPPTCNHRCKACCPPKANADG